MINRQTIIKISMKNFDCALKKITWLLFALVSLNISYAQKQFTAKASANKIEDLYRYAHPYIVTGFHGHVFLGANVPFGAVQLGHTHLSERMECCSGYHYSDSTIIGFSHTHLSGTGIGDLGDIL